MLRFYSIDNKCCWLLMLRVLVCVLLLGTRSEADVMNIRIMPPEGQQDFRHAYKMKVAKRALDLTIERYGQYRLDVISDYMTNKRAFYELADPKGKINVMFALTTDAREKMAIPIRIPIRRGALNYRLILSHRDTAGVFENIADVHELKSLSIGLGHNWVSLPALAVQGFSVEPGVDRPGLFRMLSNRRFDYMLLGIHEIYEEASLHDFDRLDLEIVPGVAVHMVMPMYLFTSKYTPNIAKRFNEGLEIMIENGDLNDFFNREFSHDIHRAKLRQRRIISIPNPLLPGTTPLTRPELWFDVTRLSQHSAQ